MEACLVIPSRVQWVASLFEHDMARNDDYLQSNDSAFCALTDFRQHCPFTVNGRRSIDDALADMARQDVRALLVTQENPEYVDLQVLGLITAYDIERERPHRSPGPSSSRRLRSLEVADVMTPWDELSLVNYDSLISFTARDIYQMFQGTGLTHLLVIDIRADGSGVARGLLSRSTLSELLLDDRSSSSRDRA